MPPLAWNRKRGATDTAINGTGGTPPSNKRRERQATDESSNDDGISPDLGFPSIPSALRYQILEYATVHDLSNFACVSHQCRKDRLHSSLPQIRVATIDCIACHDFRPVLLSIRSAENCCVFFRFKRLRLVNHAGINKITNKEAKPIKRGLRLQATSLDLSLPPTALQGSKKQRHLPACIPRQLSEIMPHLREVDLSYAVVTQSAFSDFARHCPRLEKLRWEYCDSSSAFASGQDLKKCRNLKELYMDHSCFYVPTPDPWAQYGSNVIDEALSHETLMFENPEDDLCLMYFCKSKLERVSLLDVTYYVYGEKAIRKPLTQVGLMKFVRKAENLRWFRSNLTASNVEILKRERPEITFL